MTDCFDLKNEFIACKEVLHWQIQTSACYSKHELLPDRNISKAWLGGASSGDKVDVILN